MPAANDPTVIILQACFGGALGMFLLAAAIKALLARRQPSGPPPIPLGRVAEWPYRPLDLLWLGFIFTTFFSMSIGNARLTEKQPESAISADGLIISIGFQLILAAMTVVVMAWRIRPVSWLGLHWPKWKWALLIGPAGVAAMWITTTIIYAAGYQKWLESLGIDQLQDSVKLLQSSQDPLILGLMATAAVLVAPLCEEVVFRGYFYAASKKFAGRWVAGLVSALVFAAAHGSLAPLLPLFVFGCLLALAYELTGSLWAPVFMHFCLNGATVVIQLNIDVFLQFIIRVFVETFSLLAP